MYKAAAEIGELGDNGRRLRRALAGDEVLRAALSRAGGDVVVLGHTRWASVGIISEANAHPLNQEEEGRDGLPYVVAALNGDVDNYVELRDAEGLRIADAITTDAKIIPMLVARRLARGLPLEEAFRQTVASFRGSVAIAAQSATDPDLLLLALCGSGQALYVGMAPGMFVVASEPYGLVEQTSTYLRLDGETPGNPDNPTASRGQIVVLDRRRAGALEGIRRIAYDGTELPGSRRGAAARRGDDARHPSRRSSALPAQGDLAGARIVPQDAARQDPGRGRAPCASTSASRRCRRSSASACARERSGAWW